MIRSCVVSAVVVWMSLTAAFGGSYTMKRDGDIRADASSTQDAAVVFWMKPGHIGYGAASWAFVDGEVVGVLPKDGCFFSHVSEGLHLLWVKAKGRGSVATAEMLVVAGRTYYLEYNEIALRSVDEVQGMNNLAECKYVEMSDLGRQRGVEISDRWYARAQENVTANMGPVVAKSRVPNDTRGMVRIPAGTEVEVELMENLSSRHTEEGEEILFRTTHDLELGTALTVPAGRLVRGVVHRVVRGGAGGVAGDVDVVVPALVTRDGVQIPVLGRVSAGGRGAQGRAAVMGALFGLAGSLGTTGTAAFVPAGGRYVLTVREDTWVHDRTEVERATASAVEEQAAHQTPVKADNFRIMFDPEKRIEKEVVVVSFRSDQALADASLAAVGDLELLDSMPATRLKTLKNGRCEISFPTWSVLRYVRRPDDDNLFAVPLRVTGVLEDGTRVLVSAIASIKIVERNES